MFVAYDVTVKNMYRHWKTKLKDCGIKTEIPMFWNSITLLTFRTELSNEINAKLDTAKNAALVKICPEGKQLV